MSSSPTSLRLSLAPRPSAWVRFAVAAMLAALSTACAFAAVAASLHAGDAMQYTAMSIYALFGACSGGGCAVAQVALTRVPMSPTPAALAAPAALPPRAVPAALPMVAAAAPHGSVVVASDAATLSEVEAAIAV